MKFLLFTISFIVIFLLVLGIVIPIYRKHYIVTGKAVNYDAAMRKFAYKVYMSREEIINALKIKNIADDLSCTFDFDRSVILFSEDGSSREYYFEIREYNGFAVLRLQQVSVIGMSSHIPFKLNAFFKSRLNAEMVPWVQ